MGRLILITGDRGAGKTRFCTLVARRMQQRGFDVAGMLSPARFEGTLKVGIDALDLRSNQIRPLAQLIETNPNLSRRQAIGLLMISLSPGAMVASAQQPPVIC